MTAVTLPNSSMQAGMLPGEDAWSDKMNRNLRVTDALLTIVVLSRALSAPPGADGGDCYIVGPGATGEWAAANENDIAIFQQGDDLLSQWTYVTPKTGWRAYVAEEGRHIEMTAADGWQQANNVKVLTQADPGNYTAVMDYAHKHQRFTSAAAKNLQFDDTQTYEIGAKFFGSNAGDEPLTFNVSGAFVLNFPSGLAKYVPKGASFEVTIVGAAEADVAIYPGNGLVVVTDATTAADADATNSGRYTRFTHAAAKTYTFDSASNFEIGSVYRGRVVGAGSLTLTEAGTFNINPPAGGTLVIPTNTSFTVIIVGPDEADLILA